MLDILLKEHARRPLACAQDYFKLIYQSEFGAGHMAPDPETSLERLRAECAQCGRGEDEPFERIGGGCARLNLRALARLELRLQTVNGLFLCACAKKGSVEGLEAKVQALLQGAAALGLSASQLEHEAARWREAGYPAPSHSQQYRALYRPAYRLTPEMAERFAPLFQSIDRLLREKGSARVAIDGNSGAGKSTLGALLAQVYGANLYHMDDFFLPPQRKTKQRLAEPGGNVDWERFQREVLARMGAPFAYRPWNCHEAAPGEEVRVLPQSVEIVEGVYSLHPALRDAYDLRVFLGVDRVNQRLRIRSRSGEALYERFVSEWIPLEEAYFARANVRACCQLAF